MFDCHSRLVEFHKNAITLTGAQRQQLAEVRDKNLTRLKSGLATLGCKAPVCEWDQGSYSIHTVNQSPNNDYDIDTAIVFHKDDLPSNALDARTRIEEAMKETDGNFLKPPEARTNAVTVWYAEGHHVDMAVYRSYEDTNGTTIYEHAGAEWQERNPRDITEWFNSTIRNCSPSQDAGATVEAGQLRRIIQLIKAFAKSRPSWNMPGGYIISTLVAECYVADTRRDDVALYNTLQAISQRFANFGIEVWSPVDSTQSLTYKPKYVAQVEEFRDRLSYVLQQLSILIDPSCTEAQAVNAWNLVFRHSFWAEVEVAEDRNDIGKRLGDVAAKGGAYVTRTGNVSLERPNVPSQQAPPTKFYGGSINEK